MLDALQMSLNPQALIAFVFYILGAAAVFALFAFIYTRVTPHREFVLIREGNSAAAIALGGALIGFALPVASVIAHSVSILDFLLWAVIAAVVQLTTFFVVNLVLKGLPERIQRGEVSAAVFAAAVAIGMGLLNAACMTPTPV